MTRKAAAAPSFDSPSRLQSSMISVTLSLPHRLRLIPIVDARKLLFSLSSFIAGAMTLGIAFAASLPRPWWAILTVYVTAQPMAGAFRPKVIYRLGGIATGATGGTGAAADGAEVSAAADVVDDSGADEASAPRALGENMITFAGEACWGGTAGGGGGVASATSSSTGGTGGVSADAGGSGSDSACIV